jgi:hypothetical protein
LTLMKQTHDTTRQKQKQEIEQLRTAEMSFDRRLAAGEKEARDAKTMLFNTIRESETKLERALRHLSEDHRLEVEALANKSRIECQAITAKLEQKSKACEFYLSVTAANANVFVGKDRELDQLRKQVSGLCTLSLNQTTSLPHFVEDLVD